MPTVELIYDPECPNADRARAHLRRALADMGQPSRWQEWNRADPGSPAYVRNYGSPTVLVDGRDVAGVMPSDGSNSCRVYPGEDGQLQGVPTVEMITSTLSQASKGVPPANRKGWLGILAVIPSVGAAALPAVGCPACWPAYAGLLSALGLGVVDYTPYLLPLTVVFLTVALLSLGYRARRRHKYKPLIVGIVAAWVVVVSKFVFSANAATYGGIALLLAASIWNSWPEQRTDGGSCPACSSTD